MAEAILGMIKKRSDFSDNFYFIWLISAKKNPDKNAANVIYKVSFDWRKSPASFW